MCDLTAGRAKPCKIGIGGMREFYLFNYLENPFTIVNGSITGINTALTEVYKFKIEGTGNTLASVMTPSVDNGTTVSVETLTVNLPLIDEATSLQMNNLAKGFPMAVVKDKRGNYHAIGINEGINFVITENTGGAGGDFNGYNLVGTSETYSLPPKLTGTVLTDFLALVI